MAKTNKVILIGNFGDDIKMHYFDGGGCIGRVSMATKESYTNKQGEKIENTEWHSLVFKNKLAEVVEKYTKKGAKMYVEGRLKYRQWEDKDGNKRYQTEIHVSEIEFLSASNNGSNAQSGSNNQPQSQQQPSSFAPEPDDLPF